MNQTIWNDCFMALRCLLTLTIVFSLTYVLLPFAKEKRKRLFFWTIFTGIISTALITILYHFTSDNPTLLNILFVPLLLLDGFFLLFFFAKERLPYAFFCFVLAMVVYLIIGFPTEALKNAIDGFEFKPIRSNFIEESGRRHDTITIKRNHIR